MSFAGLHYAWLCILSIILFGVGYYFQKRKQARLASWIKFDLWSSLIPDYSKKRFLLKWITLALSLVFILFSLLRPQWGEREETIDSKGMDLIFILDLSNSMLAEDVNPSRLNRAQTLIKKTLNQLADDRVGVVGFAGNAFLAIPLTTDFGYVSEVVDSLSPDAIASQGTEIGEAIDVSVKAFERGGADGRKTSRAIILISDGEDFGKGADSVATKVKEFGAGFFAFSVGTMQGAPIPVRNESGVLQTYKKDRSAKTVLSKTNPELMSRIASAAGGKFFELTNVDDAAYILTKQLLGYHRESTKEQRQVVKIDRFQIFLLIGVFFFIIHLFIGYKRTIRAAAILLLMILGNSSAEAQTLKGYLKHREAVQEYKKQDFETAAKSFESARNENNDSPVMEFNQATALAKAKKNEDAIFHYQEATKKSLAQGDFDTAAKSLYNQGLIQKEAQNFKESYQNLTKAVEMAKISGQPELEKKAREALVKAAQDQQKQQKEGKDKDSGDKGNQKQKGGGNSDDKNKDKKDGDKDDQGEQKKQPQGTEDGKKREFKSGTLSKEVAEGIMTDLSDREKQLYQRRMKEKKTKEIPHDQDW